MVVRPNILVYSAFGRRRRKHDCSILNSEAWQDASSNLEIKTANKGSDFSKRLHRWGAFHVRGDDVTRLTDSALPLLKNTWGLPFMDAELLDEVSLLGKKRSSQERARPHTLIPASLGEIFSTSLMKHAIYGTDINRFVSRRNRHK